MPKIKRKHVNALLAKAAAVFAERQTVFTGQGLGRSELRKLERLGAVQKHLMTTGAGNYLYVWKRARPIAIEPAATLDASINRPWPEKIKRGIVYRLRRRASKNKYDKEDEK